MQPDTLVSSDGGWSLREVAEAQRELVEHELDQGVAKVAPYGAFARAIKTIEPARHGRMTLLDLGCGVGHYGSLIRILAQFDSNMAALDYFGIDASPAMIEVAREREPRLGFAVASIGTFGLVSDVILHCQGAECSPYTLALITRVLREARGYIVWNKVRLAAASGYINEPTYLGHSGPIWLWTQPDLEGLLKLSERQYVIQRWPERDDTLTVILWPPTQPGQ